MTPNEYIENQKVETRQVIEDLLADGSDPDALYIIEHHFSAKSFEQLEQAAVEAFKIGFEVDEAEEIILDDGAKIVCFDAVMESALVPERIDEQVLKAVALAQKYKIDYDGWGTYFESGEEDEDFDQELGSGHKS